MDVMKCFEENKIGGLGKCHYGGDIRQLRCKL